MTADIAKRTQIFMDVLAAENEALTAGRYDALSPLLSEKRLAAENLQAALQGLQQPDFTARQQLEDMALRLDSMMAQNGLLLSHALTAQRKLVELLLHSTRERVPLGLYGQAGRYQTSGPTEAPTASRWTLATA